jgi:hypothetical protein
MARFRPEKNEKRKEMVQQKMGKKRVNGKGERGNSPSPN